MNVDARKQAVGVTTKVARLTLNEGPLDPGPDSIVDFDRFCDRKYTREERTVRMTERKIPETLLGPHVIPNALCEDVGLGKMFGKAWRDSLGE